MNRRVAVHAGGLTVRAAALGLCLVVVAACSSTSPVLAYPSTVSPAPAVSPAPDTAPDTRAAGRGGNPPAVDAGAAGGSVVAPQPTTAVSAATRRWVPKPGTTWQWQLRSTVNTSLNVAVFDLDLFDTPAPVVKRLKARGKRVICYVNVGAYENWRPDRRAFPAAVVGRSLGWPGEYWLDVRRLDVLLPIMARRFDQCRAKGFDAVEPDNVDGYTNASGFPLRSVHQLAYNRAIARLAHARGLSVGLKNNLEQVPQLVKDFDFAVNEECFKYNECSALIPFVRAGKAVFHVEYELAPRLFCRKAKQLRFSSMRKNVLLDAPRWAC